MAVAIGIVTFVYRFNTLDGPLAGFDNDHFFEIVRADAMLDGELPLRDWTDAELRSIWPPLTYAAPAVVMAMTGRSLLGEALLSVGMLAAGAVLLFWLAATFSQRLWPAFAVTLLAIGLSPTLYNYPKIVPYALAVLAMLAYARKPGRWRLAAIAATVVVATLYRHDHGVYLALTVAVLMLGVHGRGAIPPLAACACFVLVGLAPGLIFVQLHGGLLTYLRECLSTSGREAARTVDTPDPFAFDRTLPLLMRVPAPPLPPARIGVLWAETITQDAQAGAERDLGLAERQSRGAERNFSYEVDGPTPDRLAAIVRDPRVADTSGIDRNTFALTDPPAAPAATGGLFGWYVAPGLLHAGNATTWMLIVGWGVVLVSIAGLGVPPIRVALTQPAIPNAVVAAVAAMGVLLCFVFLRNPTAYRLPDVAIPVGVLGAWLLTAVPSAVRARGRVARAMVALLFAAVIGLSTVAVGALTDVPQQVRVTGIGEGLSGVADRTSAVWSALAALPESPDGIDDKLAAAAAYLRRCTEPTDRLLVAEYVPELNYFARRGVAGGQMVFFGGFYASDEAQRKTMDWWARQSVPVVLMAPEGRFEREFGTDYPLLARYVATHYQRAGSLEVRSGVPLDVWAHISRTFRPDTETGLPCVADR